MKSVLEILKTEKQWTKDVGALNKEGKPTSSIDESAIQWCLVGAVKKLLYQTPAKDVPEIPFIMLTNAIKKLYPDRGSTIGDFNDHPDTTFKDVVKVIKEAGA